MKVLMVAPSQAPHTEWLDESHAFDAEGRGYQNLLLAQAATMLKANGHAVTWLVWEADDESALGVATRAKEILPDLIVLLATTPVVESSWRLVDRLKKTAKGVWRCKVALLGSHASALPRESISNCQADYIVSGGDFDFLLTGLCARLHSGSGRSSMRLEPGIWRRSGAGAESTGQWRPDHNLSLTPSIDRDLVGLWPGRPLGKQAPWDRRAAIYAARDCWWARCGHCARKVMGPPGSYRLRSPEKVLNELGILIAKHSISSVTDMSGSLPTGLWLRRFCQGLLERGYSRKIRLSCSLKPGSVGRSEAALMAKAGFDVVAVRLHSANQQTLERLGSNMSASDMEESLRLWRAAGLKLVASAEIGWPWESAEEAMKTKGWIEGLMGEGILTSSRLTPALPFPGTPLYEECTRRSWLQAEGWADYDGRKAVMKTSLTSEQLEDIAATSAPRHGINLSGSRRFRALSVRIRQMVWRLKKWRLARARLRDTEFLGTEISLLGTAENNEAENGKHGSG